MFMRLSMSLEDFLEKSLKGEAKVSENWLKCYAECLIDKSDGNKKDILEKIDNAVLSWKDKYFIATYEEKVKSINGSVPRDKSKELDEVFDEEQMFWSMGKIGLNKDSLYDELSKYGFINDAHFASVNTAWLYNDVDFLKKEWEYYVLYQIHTLRELICIRIGVSSRNTEKGQMISQKSIKNVDDYPDIIDTKMCSELIGMSVNSIYKLTSRNEIPVCRRQNGRLLRFKKNEVLEWITSERQKTKSEAIEEMNREFSMRHIKLNS